MVSATISLPPDHSWITGSEDQSSADLEPIYCQDLESDEAQQREVIAGLLLFFGF